MRIQIESKSIIEKVPRDAESNCLSLVRIIAALQVVLGHMIEHLSLTGNSAVLHAAYFLRGVPIFFAVSGFLIWFSICRSKNYYGYLKKRFWRIYPELWAAVIIEILVLIIFYKQWEVKSLLAFAFAQSTILQFWTPSSLRGYGVGTPNGALWTIGVMVQFYLIAWYFHKLMRNRKLWAWIIGFVVSFAVSFVGSSICHYLFNTVIIEKLYDQTIVKYFWLFYIGMFIAEYNEKVLPLLQKYWYISIVVAFVFFWTEFDLYSGYWLFWSLFLVGGVIGFAYRYPRLSVSPDISYGLFLYHMTVVNIFVTFGLKGKWIYFLFVIIFALLLALISTVTIGKIAYAKKGR